MSDLTLTAANVRALREHGAVVIPGTAGAAMNVGDLVTPSADGAWDPADGNVSAALARAQGIAVASYDGETAIAAGGAVSVCVFGPVSGFDSVTHGANYYISDNVGKIADAAGAYDRIVAWGLSIVGIACLFVSPQQNDPAS
jgi:hypothetical protein